MNNIIIETARPTDLKQLKCELPKLSFIVGQIDHKMTLKLNDTKHPSLERIEHKGYAEIIQWISESYNKIGESDSLKIQILITDGKQTHLEYLIGRVYTTIKKSQLYREHYQWMLDALIWGENLKRV